MSDLLSLSSASRTAKTRDLYRPFPLDSMSEATQRFGDYFCEYGASEDGKTALWGDIKMDLGGIMTYLNADVQIHLSKALRNSRTEATYFGEARDSMRQQLTPEALAAMDENRALAYASMVFDFQNVVITRRGDDFGLTWDSGLIHASGEKRINNQSIPDFTMAYNTDNVLGSGDQNLEGYSEIIDRLNRLFGTDFRNLRTHSRPHSIELPISTNFADIFGAPMRAGSSVQINKGAQKWHKNYVTLRLSVKVLQRNVGANRRLPGFKPPYPVEAFRDEPTANDYQAFSMLRFEVSPIMTIPREYGVYMSQSEPPRLMSISNMCREFTEQNVVRQSYNDLEPSLPLSSIAKMGDMRRELGAYAQPPRTNEDGIIAAINGNYEWVGAENTPQVNAAIEAYEGASNDLYEYLAVTGQAANPTRTTQDIMMVGTPAGVIDYLLENVATRGDALTKMKVLSTVPLASSWDLNVSASINPNSGALDVERIYGSNKPSDAGLNHVVSGTVQGGLSQALKGVKTKSGQNLSGEKLEPSHMGEAQNLPVHMMFGRVAALGVAAGAVKPMDTYLLEGAQETGFSESPLTGELAAIWTGRRTGRTGSDEYWDDMLVPTNKRLNYGQLSVAFPGIAGLEELRGAMGNNDLTNKWLPVFTEAHKFCQLSAGLLDLLAVLNSGRYISKWRQLNQQDIPEDVIFDFWNRQQGDSLVGMGDYTRLALGAAYRRAALDVMAFVNSGKLYDMDLLMTYSDDERGFAPSARDIKNQLMPWLYAWGKVVANSRQISQAHDELVKTRQEAEKSKVIPVLALGEDASFSLMKHQAEKMGQLSTIPTSDWSDISPGGGKGTLTILDAVNLIGNNHVKRALILCPNDLIENYTKDLQRYAGSRWNIIPLNTKIFNQWGEDRLANLIQSAPKNTLVVAGFDWIARAGRTAYKVGDKDVEFYTALEFLRQFPWEAMLIDEVHYLRNDSNRNKVVTTLVQDPRVKFVRKLSGTLVVDTVTNVLFEARIDDPGLYGSLEDFQRQYMEDGAMTSESIGQVKTVLKKNSSYFRATKKAWAFCLPLPEYEFIPVNMDTQMQELYDKALEDAMISLEELAKNNPALRAALKKVNEADDGSEDAEGAMAMIANHLQGLERLVTDPMGDEAIEHFPDTTFESPVWGAVRDRLDHHFQVSKNKVLILCRYRRTAAAIVKNLGKYQSEAMYYDASMKENRAEFENNPKIKILVAVEQSIVNGFNLQLADRIIRIESPWSPGDLEQAESRIFRPDVGNKFGRDKVYIDWIVVNNSLQTSKVARLVSKLVDKAKFDEYGDERYDNLPEMPLIKMNLDTFKNAKTIDDYAAQFETFGQYIDIVAHDFRLAKKEADKDPNAFWTPVKGAALPEGSLNIVTPLVPGGAFPDPFNHSYVPFLEFAYDENENFIPRQYVGLPVRGPLGYGVVLDIKTKEENGRVFANSVKIRYSNVLDENGKAVEARISQGDFPILAVGTNVPPTGMALYTVPHENLVVNANAPEEALAQLSAAAAQPRGKKPLKQVLQEAAEKQAAPAPTEVEEMADKSAAPPAPKRVRQAPQTAAQVKTEKEAAAKDAGGHPPEFTVPMHLDQGAIATDGAVEAHLMTLNGVPALYLFPEDGDVKALKLPGFTAVSESVYSSIRYEEEFDKSIDFLKSKFEIAEGNIEYLERFRPLFSVGKKRRLMTSLVGTVKDVKDFKLQSTKRLSGNKIRIYVIVENEDLYLSVNILTSPAIKKMINKVTPGLPARTRWELCDPMFVWMLPKNAPKKMIQDYVKILQKNGLKISNIDELKAAYRNLPAQK